MLKWSMSSATERQARRRSQRRNAEQAAGVTKGEQYGVVDGAQDFSLVQ